MFRVTDKAIHLQELVDFVADPEAGARLEAGETIATGRVVVRSTAVGAVALAATGGGALFLLGAWARRVLNRRRARPADTISPPG